MRELEWETAGQRAGGWASANPDRRAGGPNPRPGTELTERILAARLDRRGASEPREGPSAHRHRLSPAGHADARTALRHRPHPAPSDWLASGPAGLPIGEASEAGARGGCAHVQSLQAEARPGKRRPAREFAAGGRWPAGGGDPRGGG